MIPVEEKVAAIINTNHLLVIFLFNIDAINNSIVRKTEKGTITDITYKKSSIVLGTPTGNLTIMEIII